MSSFGGSNTLLLTSAAGGGGGAYEVSRSVRFNSADSAYLNRTPASAGNRKTWTWAGWVKKANNGSDYKSFFTAFNTTSAYTALDFSDSDQLRINGLGGGSMNLVTTSVYRDLSAWYHIVVSVDTTQATESNRVKFYVNGAQVTVFGTATYPGLNTDTEISSAVNHQIGRNLYPGYPQPFNGYLADIHFIDGQALDPSSFGEFDGNGVWQPIAYAGTFGTNGFHLPFSDNSTAAALGTDTSGNSNNWTPNNFSVVSGTVVTTPASNAPPTVDYLIVGGGGGGGGLVGGGGGAGAGAEGNTAVSAGTTYTITVGTGGAGAVFTTPGTNGNPTTFINTVLGGGRGGSHQGGAIGQTGATGGCGGGGAPGNDASTFAGGATTQSAISGATMYNTAGGTSSQGTGASYRGGGGGGGSQAGATGTASGNGGNGFTSSITGSSVTYAGGGGGNEYTGGFGAGTGGTGGGGNGSTGSNNGSNATGYGSGGGGGNNGGTGSSGIVIIRYANTYDDLIVSSGLTYTYANTGGYKIYSFTASATAAQSAGNDSLVDSPTNGSQTDTGVGGEVVGNYCTWNPLRSNTANPSNGNLQTQIDDDGTRCIAGTISVTSGKWYWEITCISGNNAAIGVSNSAGALSTIGFAGGNSWIYYQNAGGVYSPSGFISYGTGWTVGDVIGVALDMDNGTLAFYKNGSSQGTAVNSGLSGKSIEPLITNGGGSPNVNAANFGQRPFAYTAPSGFKALCTTNLPTPTIANGATVMDVKLWTGDGSIRSITGLGFNPDFVWIKSRSAVGSHNLFDAVRGATNLLETQNTDAETTNATTTLTAFNSDGFSLGTSTRVNGSGTTYVAWTWDAGTSNATNTSGSITSTVRANISAGFSVVTYTGNGSATATVGHGLGVTPALVIVKSRSTSGEWPVWFTGFSASEYMYLHSTLAKTSYTPTWGSTPTSSVFGVTSGSSINNNSGTTYVAYCWTPVAGYSAFGSYTGNGSADGPFVYTGFKPRWILTKTTNRSGAGAESWFIHDAARDGYNFANQTLYPNLSSAEGGSAVDILSNGFKLRSSGNSVNGGGDTYIYAAFAEHPFATSRAR